MARFVLLFLASVALGGIAIGVSGSDRAHTDTQRRAIVRETLDDAVATVLDAAIHPRRRLWKTTDPLNGSFDVNGKAVTIEDYHLEEEGQVAAFTLSVNVGGEVMRQTSRYRLADPGWPGPLWVDAPYATADVSPDAVIDGQTSGDTHGPVFDATRFDRYRLDRVLDLNDLPNDLGSPLEDARGTLADLQVHGGMGSVLGRFNAPPVIDVVGKALNEFGPDDVRFIGDTIIDDAQSYGAYRARGDARIVHVRGDLTIGASGDVVGGGLLLVEGDLIVEGRMRWSGLVVVRTQEQAVSVDLERGDVQIRGSLVVDQEAPPPGGHTDLTVNRDLLGTWTTPYGEYGSGTPGYVTFGGNYPFYDHQHRIDHVVPEERTFYFAERGRDRHEDHTWFRRTLTDVATRYPGEEVYVRFKNARNHGSSLYRLSVDGETYEGAVATGFGTVARQGDSWASPSFDPVDLDTFIVDVQSLRMLEHLVDGSEPDSPDYPWAGSPCPSRPKCIGWMRDRDEALVVQIVRSSNDAPVYEASIYWHTHAPGQPEHTAEQAADDLWRESIRTGAGDYGATVKVGEDSKVFFETGQISRILSRLQFNTLALEHLSSFVEEVLPLDPTTPGPGGPGGPGDPGTPGTPGGPRGSVLVCHDGGTKSIPLRILPAHLRHGDRIGTCRSGGGEQ